VAGSALLVGAAIAYFTRVPRRWIAAIMAFGGGVLISALSFDLMDEAYQRGGFDSTAVGFLSGAAVYTGANWHLAHGGHGIGSAPVHSNPPSLTRVAAALPSPSARCSTESPSRSSSASARRA
jgi:zinc transporter ZupT